MKRKEFAEISAFVTIVEYGSFVRAAAHLGVTPSALSQTMQALERRLDIRLLNRTTRSVAPTATGARYAAALRPLLAELDVAAASMRKGDGPRGIVRVNTSRTAALHFLAPRLADFAAAYPRIQVELVLDDGFADIVKSGCDAGVRLGHKLEKDMVAMKLGGDLSMAVVASPQYLVAHGVPREPADLHRHLCLNWRNANDGAMHRWEFERRGRVTTIGVEGPLVARDTDVIVRAACDGAGIGYLLDIDARASLEDGSLVRLLAPWCPAFSGFHLYYPHRLSKSAPLRVLVDFLGSR